MKKILILFSFVVLLSCQRDIVNKQLLSISDLNYVSVETATQIAKVQAPLIANGKTEKKKIKSVVPVNPDITSMYVFNFEGGGFMIVAADNRLTPVLAYSDDNSFNMDENTPTGVVIWLKNIHDVATIIKNENMKQNKFVGKLWEQGPKSVLQTITNIRRSSSSSPVAKTQAVNIWDDGDCNSGASSYTTYIQVDPLLVTAWDQNRTYNDACPNLNCAVVGSPGNLNAWAGCVATAIGQVMRYYQYPSSFNWASMQNTTGSPETARLLADIGPKVGMHYGCTASTADDDADIPGAFHSYGYNMPTYSDYDIWTASGEFQNGRPVILGGCRETWWIFGWKDCHTWVADGVNQAIYYWCAPDPNTPGEWVSSYQYYSASIHMNWGSGPSNYNAWYDCSSFVLPTGQSYNVHQKMTHYIIP